MGNLGWTYWVAAPLAVAAVFVAGVLVGLPALRLRGLTLAIVTLSLALLADNFLFTDVNWLTNNGNHWSITPPALFGVRLDNGSLADTEALYRVVLVVVIVTLLAIVRLREGRTGKSWYAMRDAEIAAATSGVPTVSAKLLGFGIAAALAALGGVLHLLTLGNASPDPYNFAISIQLLALAVIAGVRSLPGALLAAFFFAVLPQVLLAQKELSSLTSLILGAGLIVQIIFAPQGLGGTFELIRRRLFGRVERSAEVETFGAATAVTARGGARPAQGGDDGAL
jgi:branched-chain amino acid transport system permease protein